MGILNLDEMIKLFFKEAIPVYISRNSTIFPGFCWHRILLNYFFFANWSRITMRYDYSFIVLHFSYMDNFEFVFIYLRAIENSFYMTYLIVYFANFSIGLYVLFICWHCLCFKEIGFLLGYVLQIIFFCLRFIFWFCLQCFFHAENFNFHLIKFGNCI